MTDNSNPGTLSDLISQARFKLRWFDLGRRVRSVPRSAADAFEAGDAPWPHPYLREAWVGLLLWPEEGGEPAVWFLRLPLDEQGKLQFAARDNFLALLNRKLVAGDGSDAGEQLGSALSESGLVYSPPPERQATFHAHAARLLRRAPSAHYENVLAYLRAPDSGTWGHLGLQGIADVSARWEEHRQLIDEALPQIAAPVFVSLCQCLESEAIDHRLAAAIIRRADAELQQQQPEAAILAAAVRGISFSPARGLRHEFLQRLLHSDRARAGETLAAMGSRCPEDLQEPALAALWLTALAESQKQETFNLLLADLMFLPATRTALLDALRSPERPEALARAFGVFLHGPQPTH
ncbi:MULTISPECIES: DUF3549 family protein [Microbulbifer]|uniref:DUF3549 family protein n=1 Tax=Microbulbifer TaxID=48073 RepID=UPI001E53E259|nr:MULTISPECIES: DUF3549 family protein [Microbulbifer]UHQ56365.1 DUF3549 family protein [Microbulbifer sp. YPW16]